MSPFALNLEKPKVETSIVSLEPAINCFGSMILLAKNEGDPGIHEWVEKTRAQMNAEEFFNHRLVTIGFYYAIVPREKSNSFEAYLEGLDQMQPSAFRDNLLNSYATICIPEEAQKDKDSPVNWDEVLSSAENYVEFLRRRFGDELTEVELETRAYQYVIDPAALKQLITSHLRWFWKSHLQPEWTRVRPMLEESVRAFNQIDMSAMTRQELVRFITGKEFDEPKWLDILETANELVFVPNAHIGPYIHKTQLNDKYYIYFGAHLPEGSKIHIPELDRAEIVARLSALADDTRLRILQMISERGEMRAQDIIDETGLSQPSVSRYLVQLTATGYLQERRVNGAKAYTLNYDRIEKTLKAVSAFLLNRS
ncbi:MAG: helix-turn-helix transcriptional regulator [Chloroflexi bacterium]|nr:helix-turn-helix transcriptional regulator [Chloroflexota bacterium]